ncbi:MAG: AEC family transporter [Proteobacteria bacterium]|nr:AEC family transporter [Pseudomonadota bacterium]
MDVAVSLVLAIFGVIAVGFIAARTGFLARAAIDGVDRYVFTFALPALMFRSLANTELPATLPWGLWLCYYPATLLVWAVGSTIARLVLRRSFGESAVIGFGGAQANTVLLGIPIILTGLGDKAGPPLFFILAFHGIIVISLAIFLLEMTKSDDDGERRTASAAIRMGLRGTARNPIILGLFGGILYGQLGVAIPGPIDHMLQLLGRSAIPCALFVLGALLNRYHLGHNLGTASLTSVFKLLIHPALVWLLATFVFTLPPLWTAVATILASMPTGVYSSILANSYQTAPGEASSAVVLSTALSVFTITLLLSWFLAQ